MKLWLSVKLWLKKPVVLLVLITVLAALIYTPSLKNPFQLDDLHSIASNPNIRSLNNVPLYFTSSDYFSVFGRGQNMYRPVLLSTYALNYYWSGLAPAGYHALNLLFHLLVILAVYALVSRLFRRTDIAVISAAIFALHPFQSEVVNYISARSSAMATLFYILAVYLFLIFRHGQESGRGGLRNGGIYLLFLASFVLAFLSKEIGITLPAILFLIDLLIVGIKSRRDFLIKSIAYLPFLVVALVFSFQIDLLAILMGANYAHPATLVQVLFKTPWLLLFPLGLSADHPVFPGASFLHPAVLFPLLFLTALLACAIALAFSSGPARRVLAFFLFWFFLTSLPTTLFALNQAFVEHRGYLPSVGLIPLAAAAVAWAWERVSGGAGYSRRIAFSLVGLGLGLFCVQGVAARAQIWHDPVRLWTDTLEKYPHSKLGQIFLAHAYSLEGRDDRAAEIYQEVIRADPECEHRFSCTKAHFILGLYYQKAGRLEDALREYEETLQWLPDSYMVRYRLGTIYQARGDGAAAMQWYQEALKRNGTAYEVRYALGSVYEARKELDLAKREYETALKLRPAFHPARNRLGGIWIQKDGLEQAQELFSQVLRQEPENSDAHYGLGFIAEAQEDLDWAIEHYQAATRTGRNSPGLRYRLGALYLRTAREEMAIAEWQKALEEKPDFLEARLSLARLLQEQGHRDKAVEQYRILLSMPTSAGGEWTRQLRGELERLLKKEPF